MVRSFVEVPCGAVSHMGPQQALLARRGRGGHKRGSFISFPHRFSQPTFLPPLPMSSSPATAPTGPGAGLRPGTIQARLELDDNISNFHHRLSRFDSKQTTLRSVGNALAMVIPAAVS